MATKTINCTKDAVMGKQTSGGSFSGWNGKDNHLQIGATSNYKWRSVVYFPIDFTGMTGINSATLHLTTSTTSSHHQPQLSAPTSLLVRRMTSDWGEGSTDPGEGNLTSSLSWDWDNRYDKYTTSGQNSKNISQGSSGSEETISVTDIVKSWFNGSNNYGIMLINNTSESNLNYALLFFARESSSNKPYLVIDYDTNVAPNAPTNLSPDGSIVNTLTPSFSGTRSDPDSGDSISGVQIKTYAPIGEFKWSASTSASDPGAGYIRFNLGNVYVSETDRNGADITSALAAIPGTSTELYLVARSDPSKFRRLNGNITGTDNGSWRTIAQSVAEWSTSGTMTADEVVYIIANVDTGLAWDSGNVAVSGSPSTFSVTYGSSGSSSALQGNMCYAWSARTKDSGALWGPFSSLSLFKANSAPSTPTVAVLNTPINDINTTTPQFTVTHSDVDVDDQNMYYYRAIVEAYSAGTWSTYWDSGDISVTPTTTTTVTSGSLAFGGHYRVKARTQDSNGSWSNYSAGVEFYTHKAQVPVNLTPTGGGSTSTVPTFTGDAASATDVITAFSIAVYTSDLASTLLSRTRYTTTIYPGGTGFSKAYAGSALTPGTTYVWNVGIETASGDVSAYSSNQSFIVVDATYPEITAPLGSNSYTLTPTITGSRQSTFNRFKYEIYPQSSTDVSLGTAIYQSSSLSATITGSSPTTFSTVYGGSPALSYATTYKIRCAVSSDAGASWSGWSGLVSFTTDSASVGSPNSPTDGQWINTLTPAFYINRGGSDTIDQMQVRVWDKTDTNIIWDSGMTDVTNGTTNVGPITYAGTALVGGTTYHWDFRYQKTGGAVGGWSSKYAFRVNGAPTASTNLFPSPGYTFADTLFPTFRATFNDPDQTTNSDYPVSWYIRIEDGSGTVLTDKNITSSLVAGQNQYVWQAGDRPFAYSTDYMWQTWYKDSWNSVGAYSSPITFRLGVSPNGTITTPTNGSTISDSTPDINWSYTGGTQQKYRVRVWLTDSSGVTDSLKFDSGYKTGTGTTYTIPAGILKDRKYYTIQLDVISTDGLSDPSPSSVNVQLVQDAPDPITGLSLTTDNESSFVQLDWDAWATQTGHTFKNYQIERRLVQDDSFTVIGTVSPRTNSTYTDWYAAEGVMYQYRVTVQTTKTGNENVLESPDDTNGGNLATGILDTEAWMFVGYDRSPEHIAELFVSDESHNRPVQQESFETLGSNRKTIIRGFVLGNEGSITIIYNGANMVPSPTDPQVFYPETVLGRRLVDYLTFHAGPHILKSPFGDVWDVEFASPEYKWMQGGHLQVDLSWIETGNTSQNGSI